MVEVLFQTFSPIISNMIKMKYSLYEVAEIFILCHFTYKLVENLRRKKHSRMANISKMLYLKLSYGIFTFCKEIYFLMHKYSNSNTFFDKLNSDFFL